MQWNKINAIKDLLQCLFYFVTDRISEEGNAIASVRLYVRLFPLYLRNQLAVDLELLHVNRS